VESTSLERNRFQNMCARHLVYPKNDTKIVSTFRHGTIRRLLDRTLRKIYLKNY